MGCKTQQEDEVCKAVPVERAGKGDNQELDAKLIRIEALHELADLLARKEEVIRPVADDKELGLVVVVRGLIELGEQSFKFADVSSTHCGGEHWRDLFLLAGPDFAARELDDRVGGQWLGDFNEVDLEDALVGNGPFKRKVEWLAIELGVAPAALDRAPCPCGGREGKEEMRKR